MKTVLSYTGSGEPILKILPETDLEADLLWNFASEPPARRTNDADVHIVIFSKQRLPKELTQPTEEG